MSGADGLRQIVQRRLIDEVLKPSGEKWPGWMVLVVDKEGMRMVSSVLGMYDLMENRVTIVENIDLKRAPFKEMAVIYLVSPTEESVSKIIADWEGDKKLYGNGAFLYFTNCLTDELLGKIKACKPLLKRVKAFGEINIDFLAKESRAYHFDMRTCFNKIFNNKADKPTPSEETIAGKLVTVCATLNEYPYVRFRADAPVSKRLAKCFHDKMNTFVQTNTEWWYNGDGDHKARDRSTLLIIDRTEDCLSPLMHELTYQAMVNDLLPVKDDKIKYKSDTAAKSDDGEASVEKEVLLDDNDALWVELRGKHIAEVINVLSTRIKDIVANNSTAKLESDSGGNVSIGDMAAALKAMPEYKEMMSKMAQHMHLSQQCMNKFHKLGLLELTELEQTLATGQTEDGSTPSLPDLIEKVLAHMPNIKQISRIRLLAIFIVSQKGIKEEDREKLYAAAELEDYQKKILNNLQILGISIDKEEQASTLTSFFTSKKITSSGRVHADSEYASMRYVCHLKTLLEDLTHERLSFDNYPSIVPMPPGKTSAASSVRTRSVRPTRHHTATKSKKQFQGSRVMVFVCGGLCYSELRAGYEVMAAGEKEVILGSTAFINPSNFVEDLFSLSV